ncbi:autotransporter domain-containing protein [Salmonella enterica]
MKKSRISQHGSLLVALTSAQGLLAPYALAASSSETISTSVDSGRVISTTFDTLQITDQGSLTYTNGPALQISTEGNLNLFDNDGTLYGSSSYALTSSGIIGTIDNSGLINNANGYGAIYLDSTSQTGTLINSGTIGNTDSTYSSGFSISNYGTLGTLKNTETGLITGRLGVYNGGTINLLDNAGTLTNANSDSNGIGVIYNTGTINTLNNSGTITSSNVNSDFGSNVAVRNYGSIGTLINSGSILSSSYAILNNSSQSVIGTLINSGLIKAPQAIYLYNYYNTDDAHTIVNSGTIAGNIYSYSTSNQGLVIAGGTDTTGTLTGYADGIGYLQTNGSGITFSSGSLLLNDYIYTNGGTVLNDAAKLTVVNPLTIEGNYHQNAGAALILGVSDSVSAAGDYSSDYGYGRLTVNGSATVDEGSSISLSRTGNTYKFATGQRYVVIDASSTDTNYNASKLKYSASGYTGTVTGTEYNDGTRSALVLSLVDAPATTTPEPAKGTNTGTPVTTTPVTSPTTPVVTTPTTPSTPVVTHHDWATIPSATAALGGLTHYSGISPQLLELYNASLAIEGEEEANRVGERLSSSQNINASTATGAAISKAMTVVGTHMDSVRNPQASGVSGVSTGDDYSSNWIVWGQPFGGFAHQQSTDNVSGYRAKFGGLLLGADRAFGDAWRAGAAVNFSNTSVHGKDNLAGNTSTADNYGIIGYAGYTGNPWYLNLSAGINRQNYESSRQADFTGFSGQAHGKFNGQSVTLQSEVGYPFTLPADIVLTPLASLTYGYQHVDGYQESGGNGMALKVDSSHSQSVLSDIGARIEKSIPTRLGTLTPFAQISWIHQYDNRRMSSSATFAADTIGETQFTTKGAAPVKDMAGVAIGSTLYDANNLSLDARYDLQAGERYQAHTFSLRLRKTF